MNQRLFTENIIIYDFQIISGIIFFLELLEALCVKIFVTQKWDRFIWKKVDLTQTTFLSTN